MNSIELMNRFHKFEEKYDLFDDLVDNVSWWDVVRYDVYSLLAEISLGRQAVHSSPKKRRWHSMIGAVLRRLLRWQLYNELKRESGHTLIFRAPRAFVDGKRVDIITDPISKFVPGKVTRIDTVPRRFHVPTDSKSLFFNIDRMNVSKLIENFLLEFNIDPSCNVDFLNLIKRSLAKFNAEFYGYNKIINLSKPKLILLFQNGIEKSLFASANLNQVPVVEVQHGLIGYTHPAYSYSRLLKYDKQTTFPTAFLAFSEHWITSCYYPVEHRIPVGNDSYSLKKVSEFPEGNALMFISADVYHDALVDWVFALSKLIPDRLILYKLHPNQLKMFPEIEKKFKRLSNVRVISSKTPISQLLNEVSHVIAVCSTVIYEALQAGRGVFLIPIQDYHNHSDVIGLPSVTVTRNPEQAVRHLLKDSDPIIRPQFFDPFDGEVTEKLLFSLMFKNG